MLVANYGYAPTGDACIPFMGCHWILSGTSAPVFPQWIIGYDEAGALQFTEVMTTNPMPFQKFQWQLIPAGVIPEFGNNDWYFRHVHMKEWTSGCEVLCTPPTASMSDCHKDATCIWNPSLPPYFNCICPNTTGVISVNNGRGTDGCMTCPAGMKANPTRNLCVDACDAGYTPDASGTCIDNNECTGPLNSCAKDEDCVNLLGQPFSCVYKQITDASRTLLAKVTASATLDVLTTTLNVPGVSVKAFTIGKKGELVLTLSSLSSVNKDTVASSFSAWSGVTLVGVADASRNVVTLSDPSANDVNYQEPDSGAATNALAAAVAVAVGVVSVFY